MADNQMSTKDMFLRAIAVLGLIAILLLGAWGIIQLAVNLPSFLANVGGSVSSVFTRESNSTTTPASPVAPTAPTTPTKPAGTVGGGTGSTYVPSGVRTNLYGASDLAVRLIAGVPYGDRYTVTFEIGNYGTNMAPSGWNFTAELPMGGDEYPYHSAPQQALYPGDRIVYTLGFSTDDYGYYERNCEWDSRDDEWNCDDNNDNRRDRDDEEVIITADPYGQVYEINERNNSIEFEI